MRNYRAIAPLTENQAEELEVLDEYYRAHAVHASYRGMLLGEFASFCLVALRVKTKPEVARIAAEMQNDTLRHLERFLRRRLSGDELIRELARVIPVPPWLEDAFHRDFGPLQT